MNNTHIPNLMAVHIYTLAYHILTIVGGGMVLIIR